MKYISVLLFFILAQVSFSQKELSSDVIKNIEKRIEYGMNPSIVLGVVDKKGPVYYSYGNKTIGGEAVDEHSIYEIGSISKVFTAILLADAVEKGVVNLDDPISLHLPQGVNIPRYKGKDITLAHLSDHTSSLPRMPDNFNPADPNNPYADYTPELLYDFLSSVELEREIGSEYEYSNLAQGLLGHILALKAGKSYEELLAEVITQPLGMNETKVTFDKHMTDNLAIGHDAGVPVSNWDIATLTGAGAIRSSIHDMLIFLQANMGLEKSTLKSAMDMTHKVRHNKAGNQGVGLGWHIIEDGKNEYVSHGGATGGYRAFTAIDKKNKRGVVVLTNSSNGADDLARYLMSGEGELKEAKRDIASVVRKMIDEKGVDAAIKKYNYIKENKGDEYAFDEGNMNMLGYAYLRDENIDEALAIFKLNMEEYPMSANTYDSYAEGLMNQSIAYYKKSIEMNPNNQNGFDMLEKMGVSMEVKSVEVGQETLNTYVGKYQLAPTFFITVTSADGQLFAQATGQERFELFPTSPTKYYLKVVDAQVEFYSNDQGEVSSMTLFQNGQEMPGEKIE